jgi:NAD(P)H dehydrogenase (quinone)
MTVAITGASGQLGRATADRLLEELDAAEVVLVTRNPTAIDDYTQQGVTVRRGDFDDPASLDEAFAGVDRVLVISASDIGRRIPQHVAAIEAAKKAGARHVLYTSITNPSAENPAFVVDDHRGTEEALRASGLQWTMLRNAMYGEFRIPGLQEAAQSGRLVHNHGDGGTAYVSRLDCAAVAAAVLAGEGHEGKAYDITGPSLVTGADLAAIASELGGREVEAIAVDDDTFVAGLVEHAGLPEPLARGLASFGQAIREGYLSQVSTVVEDLTGQTPRSVRDLALAAASVA